MAFNEQAQAVTMIAATDLTIHRFVVVNGEKTAGLASAADVDGICGETVLAGEGFPMAYSGIGTIILAATLAAGARVSSDAAGAAIAAGAAGELTAGKLINGGVAGDIVPILIDIVRQHA